MNRLFPALSSPTGATLLALLGAACSPPQPPHWAEGGAPLALGAAHWDRESGGPVDLLPDGKVLIDGDLAYVVDRAGRVTNADYDAFAVLLPDGELAGASDRALGQVGTTNAAPPGDREAWLSLTPDGKVTYFESDGERTPGGVWRGCSGPVLRTCTLVTHVIAVQDYVRGRTAPGIGIGIGVGVGVGF